MRLNAPTEIVQATSSSTPSITDDMITEFRKMVGGVNVMKFRTSWRIEQDKWLPILKKWPSLTPEQRADLGPGVKLIGRSHDTGARTGVAIFEATDALALSRYLARW